MSTQKKVGVGFAILISRVLHLIAAPRNRVFPLKCACLELSYLLGQSINQSIREANDRMHFSLPSLRFQRRIKWKGKNLAEVTERNTYEILIVFVHKKDTKFEVGLLSKPEKMGNISSQLLLSSQKHFKASVSECNIRYLSLLTLSKQKWVDRHKEGGIKIKKRKK